MVPLTSSFLFTTATIFSFLFLYLPTLSTSQNNYSYFYEACKPHVCGTVAVTFPFFSTEPFCGLPGFMITCDPSSSLPTITFSDRPYQVNTISLDDSLLLVSDSQLAQQLRSNSCDAAGLRNHFLPATGFASFQIPNWISYLNFSWCHRDGGPLPPNFTSETVKYGGCQGNTSLYFLSGTLNNDTMLPAACDHALLPILLTSIVEANLTLAKLRNSSVVQWDYLFPLLDKGFALQWDYNDTNCSVCQDSGGRCGYNQTTREPLCFCKDRCNRDGNVGATKFGTWKIVLAAVVPTAFLAGLFAFVKFKEKGASLFHRLIRKRSTRPSGDSEIKEFISDYKSMLTTEYSYADVRKITNGFKEKLGEGGYGNVYKGKLPNGLLVAAKVLEKTKGNGQDFVNEVATIGRIHHVNVIRLLGFCCDGTRRALFYELMPRGSLADLISKEEMRQKLGAQRLLDIALGIARGVEYLHNGCEKRILHLDIKPQNVLLDSRLQPKISDFGLARSYSRKDSSVSLTGARGTVGYIAPEVFLRSLGGVSHKSDVYSFGMLLLEMAMGKKDAAAETERSSENKYFPDWIYNQLQEWLRVDMEDVVAVVEEDVAILKKMVMVGLWCIQTDPVSRPSMLGVVEMLRGAAELIDMPPKPRLFSPPRQQPKESTSYGDDGTRSFYYTFESESC
ncbi:rust resistance kinase Lr10-like [Musa acuminata AAA Group]|uniref:rust resistance kinase Lr10-like n=1 Tax=Musa acuminata AAA Group TaxID=214697 RepID=UPI0031D757FD